MSRRPVSKTAAFSIASSGRNWLGVSMIFVLLAAGASGAKAVENVGEAIAGEVRAVFEKCRTAVVKIEAVDEHGALAGTGFFVDPNGTLYTSFTIGGDTHDITVWIDGQKIPAERLLSDSRSGIAILKIDRQTPFLMLGKSSELGVASPVMVLGYPMDLPLTPAFGLVGGFDVKYLGHFFSTAHIRANVPVQRGEGGAPLLNLHGEVIGVLISSLEDNSSGGFALPIEAAEKVRRDFLRFGEVRPGWLGVVVAAAEKEGVQVADFAGDAPAQKAGVRRGDILTQVGVTQIKSTEDVLNASFYLTAGDEVPITVLRDGKSIAFKVESSAHPNAPRATEQALSPRKPRAMSLTTEK